MFLLRHAQSYFNLRFNETRIDPGIEDPELTPLGVTQAAAAAKKLAAAPLTRIIVSPYTRALQTAQPILDWHQVPVTIMHEVREQAAFTCDIGSKPVSAPRF
jgi:broad specificity phosphatase PhoE